LQEVAGALHNNSLSIYDAETLAGFWALWRQHGGWWSERDIPLEPEVTGIVQQPLPVREPEFAGDEGAFPFHLYPYPSVTLTTGQGANQPWLQEAPDPMTTARWSTWVELNPETAFQLGVTDNDVVRVKSPYGELEAAVVVYPGIRPDVVAIPVGQGHSDYGRFAAARGENPIALLAPVTDADTGALAWGATRVSVEPTGRRYTLARLESLDGEGRESLG
jgi:anaerobic selenocysteine-containing dehydrogenase